MEGYEIENRGGLVALEYPDHEWENPLTWWGIKERGKCEMESVKGERVSDPGEIECPTCEGRGELVLAIPGWPSVEVKCPGCEGYGERPAKTMEEWCRAYGARAAVPVSYYLGGTQPWIRTEKWDDLEDACSILYLDGDEGDEEVIEGRIADLSVALEVGYSVVGVEVDPDGDLPEDALEGAEVLAVGMVLGREAVADMADELLRGAEAYLERELTARGEYEARGVKVGGADGRRRVTLERDDLLELVRYAVSDLNGADGWWASWDEEKDGPDPERAALVRAVEAARVALEEGGTLTVPPGPALEVPAVE